MRKHRSIFTIFILSFELNSDAIKKLQGDNNEFVIIPGAVHTDLYYRMDAISFDKYRSFVHEVSEIKSERLGQNPALNRKTSGVLPLGKFPLVFYC